MWVNIMKLMFLNELSSAAATTTTKSRYRCHNKYRLSIETKGIVINSDFGSKKKKTSPAETKRRNESYTSSFSI
ncbi:hypothetical protein DERP_012310 [Dermatophagoides pteronyssinus]|uniref:Secreted protein n=1 Tax=Dermatophagoides pteronyssinus TaxID=6956 RepID=A0ABQ8JQD7_DERPT|nr:hypothetical protein DERP_012310 [Dermatophagoides pteronyssinus]